ncbi:hypothetical protein DER30_6190 [Streptomyces sp. HB202]|nr:hypothetical protein DER30_6190 [Streptomyces sp. HB202]
MTEVPLQINAIIIDAADPERLTTFWSELLGRPIVDRSGPYVWLRREKGVGIGFQQADEPHPKEKNRMHFDIAPSDPAAEQQRSRRSEGGAWRSTPTGFSGDGRPGRQ